jgi:hypothetical protein
MNSSARPSVTFVALNVLLFCFSVPVIADEWICTEASSRRTGSQILACGVGLGVTESEARNKAFENARTEFSNVCKNSSDCVDHSVILTPKRTSCEVVKNGKKQSGYKCYRALVFDIEPNKDTVITRPTAPTDEKTIESATASDTTTRAKYECTEKVFNKTWGHRHGRKPNMRG